MEINPMDFLSDSKKEQLGELVSVKLTEAIKDFDFTKCIKDSFEDGLTDFVEEAINVMDANYAADRICDDIDFDVLTEMLQDKLAKALKGKL